MLTTVECFSFPVFNDDDPEVSRDIDSVIRQTTAMVRRRVIDIYLAHVFTDHGDGGGDRIATYWKAETVTAGCTREAALERELSRLDMSSG